MGKVLRGVLFWVDESHLKQKTHSFYGYPGIWMRAYQNAGFRVDGLKPRGHMADPMAYYMNVPTYATFGGV